MDVVRCKAQHGVEAFPEAGIVVPRKPVNEVKAVNDPFRLQEVDLFTEDAHVERAVNGTQDLFMNRLQSDLHRAMQLPEQAHCLTVQKIGLGLQVIVQLRGLLPKHLQQLDAAFRRVIEGGVQHPDLAGALAEEESEFRFKASRWQWPYTSMSARIEAVVTGEGATAGDFPEDTALLAGVQGAG